MTISRRTCACLLLALAPTIFLLATHSSAKTTNRYFVYAGTYTAKTNSKGIYVFPFDVQSGKPGAPVVAAETPDPSFLAISPNKKYLYAVNELTTFEGQSTGAITAYSLDRATGKLSQLNRVSSRGAGPCHISLDRTGKYVLVANYDSGSVATFPVLKNGALGAASAFVQHTGSGPNQERQPGPHAHWIATSPDNRFALAADLGSDEVLVYRFSAENGSLTPANPPFVKLSPGGGPRHFGFHPHAPFAYVLSEMQSTVTAFAYEEKTGRFSTMQTLSTLPESFKSQNDAAELFVHPEGKFLYASNRGHDSIAVFSIDPAKGTLTFTGDFPTGGKTPRNFAIDPTGNFLLAANQESDAVVIFRINRSTGALTPSGESISIPAPVDLLFVPAR